MKNAKHPGRSIDFLSRLHDGELSAGERARFESHRSHCAECRRAAAEFESALSLYRSAPTSPASPDLAGRILRRLQTAAPARRRPFGIFYGIDVRWAGAFAAALLALIIGSAVVVRQQTAPRAEVAATPIPVQLRKSGEETQAASAEPPAAQNRAMAEPAPRPNEADADVSREAKARVDALSTEGAQDDWFEEKGSQAAP
ncbi:MAG: anti-sigma factor, partial [Thermoanaerobaculia bacterium]